MSKHHRLARPSNAKRWLNCPGSLLLSETMPHQPSNAAADAGTEMHERCAKVLDDSDPGDCYTAADFAAYEDAETMAVYVNHCISLRAIPDSYSRSEFTLPDGADVPGGTPDFFAIYQEPANPSRFVVEVVDLKTGRNPVIAADNDQLGIYATLLRISPQLRDNAVAIYVTIAQFGKLYRAELSQAYMTRLAHRARQALPPTMRFAMGDWCQYCPALSVCPQMRYELHTVIWADSGKTVCEATPELYSLGLHARVWSDIVIRAATSAAALGNLPGYTFAQQKGKWSWQDDTAAVREYLTPDQLELPSVSAAKKLLEGNKVALATIAACSKQSTYGVLRAGKPASVFEI